MPPIKKVRQAKVYLCLEFKQDIITRIRTRRVWYSLTREAFAKFLEEFAYWNTAENKNIYRWGERITNPPYFRGVKRDKIKNKYIVVDSEYSNDTHIFYPQEWDTDDFLEVVYKFNYSLYESLIEENFVLDNE